MTVFNNVVENNLKNKLIGMGINPLDLMVTGVTGAGKSTTINKLFNSTVTSVGTGVEPETMKITGHSLGQYFRVWDTPGLGDGIQRDIEHTRNIVDTLYATYHVDGVEYGLIDLALVVIEGATRDMGTTYRLLNEIVIPNIQNDRIIIAVNQADMAMKGRHWDYDRNKPKNKLFDFLNDKSQSIKDRIKEATGVDVEKPIFYSAEHGYNIDLLLNTIINMTPREKRLLM